MTQLVELGGNYGKAAEPWGENVVVDGKLITGEPFLLSHWKGIPFTTLNVGQNPASAKGVGEAILKALS
jgi:putative intracellular protease/amidase